MIWCCSIICSSQSTWNSKFINFSFEFVVNSTAVISSLSINVSSKYHSQIICLDMSIKTAWTIFIFYQYSINVQLTVSLCSICIFLVVYCNNVIPICKCRRIVILDRMSGTACTNKETCSNFHLYIFCSPQTNVVLPLTFCWTCIITNTYQIIIQFNFSSRRNICDVTCPQLYSKISWWHSI